MSRFFKVLLGFHSFPPKSHLPGHVSILEHRRSFFLSVYLIQYVCGAPSICWWCTDLRSDEISCHDNSKVRLHIFNHRQFSRSLKVKGRTMFRVWHLSLLYLFGSIDKSLLSNHSNGITFNCRAALAKNHFGVPVHNLVPTGAWFICCQSGPRLLVLLSWTGL